MARFRPWQFNWPRPMSGFSAWRRNTSVWVPFFGRLASTSSLAAMLALRPLLARTGPVNRIVAGIGEASYSIYLCHWFVLSALGKVFGRLDLPADADAAVRIAGCLVALAVGCVFFVKLERPLDRRLRGQRKATAGLVPAT